MEFMRYAEGQFILIADDNGLIMDRQEAEDLFVQIGHTLQDDDIYRFVEETTDGEQPDDYSREPSN